MILKFDHYFPYVNGNRKIHLYIPNNYYETDEKYPVIYFLLVIHFLECHYN